MTSPDSLKGLVERLRDRSGRWASRLHNPSGNALFVIESDARLMDEAAAAILALLEDLASMTGLRNAELEISAAVSRTLDAEKRRFNIIDALSVVAEDEGSW